MPSINLAEDELTKLLEAVNGGAEPSSELAGKLFPSLMEKLSQEGKFDFETLNCIRIATIEYAGKRSEGVILASAVALGQSAPLQVVRSFGDPVDDGWQNLVIQGDNLQFLKTVYLNQDPLIRDKIKGKVKLIYIDPPFATKADFQSRDGATSYSDKIESAEFLENLRERLIFMREVLTADGCIYLHLDTKKSHYLKVIMDEVLGNSNFRNEIIRIKCNPKNYTTASFGNYHDTILFYSKSPSANLNRVYQERDEIGLTEDFPQLETETGRKYTTVALHAKGLRRGPTGLPWRGVSPPSGRHWAYVPETLDQFDANGLIEWSSKGNPRLKRYADADDGKAVQDIWEYKDPGDRAALYPTQKPEALIERIIKASSNPGDLVMDVFAGSGTTAAVSEKLGRRWIACDFGKHAIYTIQQRLFNIANSIAVDTTKKDAKHGQPSRPFAVATVGAYDFSRIMHLRENKCAYIAFVLALFGIPKEEKDYIAKYKLDHIYAEKDGDPVEIFPVWEDEYLYNVRIDLEYMKEIITQSRGRLKGNYYIVVPENCTQVSDTILPNGTGGEVHFRFLKFPYSILEQAARNFAIEDQPDTPANINNLVSSVGFYFNDEVTVTAARTANGIRITDFTTPILNRNGAQYAGLSGLSLLLVDLNYNGEVFTMDSA